MFTLTQLGEGWIVLLLLTAIYSGSSFNGLWYKQSFVTILATGVVCQIVKKYFPRARPVRVLPGVHVVGKQLKAGSFPSGHTATSFSLALLFSSYWPELSDGLFALAGLIGLTRVYIGAHFPFDVMWGAVIGLSISSLISAFLLASPALGITNPLSIIFGITLLAALSLPLLGGYSFRKMRDRLQKKALCWQAAIKESGLR